MNSTKLRNRIIELTDAQPTEVNNVYKESLRALLSEMSNLYYLDGNGNDVKCKCIYGNPERLASTLYTDNTLILPMVSVVETSTENDDRRRRYSKVIVNETYWDPNKKRATRTLSVAPRPVTLTYEVSLWSKYKYDLDMLRSSIYSLFSPEVNLRTKFSDYGKAYIVSEQDVGNTQASDTEDRLLRKSITISLQTYIPSPKFMVTNTGEILPEKFFAEVSVPDSQPGGVTVTEVTSPIPEEDTPTEPDTSVNLSLSNIEMGLSVIGEFSIPSQNLILGNIEMDLSVIGDFLAGGNSIVSALPVSITTSNALSLKTDLNLELLEMGTSNVLSLNTDLNFSLPDNMVSPDVNNNVISDLGNVEMTLSILGDFVATNVTDTISVDPVQMTLEDTVIGLELGGSTLGIVMALSDNVMSVNTDLNFSLPEGMASPPDPNP